MIQVLLRWGAFDCAAWHRDVHGVHGAGLFRQKKKPTPSFTFSFLVDDRLLLDDSMLLRPLGSQDELYKHENFGWLVDVATDRPARYLEPARMYKTENKQKNRKFVLKNEKHLIILEKKT